jgi:hypothetical protein
MFRKLSLAAAFILVAAATRTATAGNNCPPPRHYSGVCTQVIVWAQDPATGMCCQYSTPCSAPEGWTIYYGPDCTSGGIEL